MVCDKEGVKIFDISALGSVPASQKLLGQCYKSKINPHVKNAVTVLQSEGVVACYDMASPEIKTVFRLENAHKAGGACDFDHNPNRLHTLATGGKDCALKFWDTRKTTKDSQPISIMLGHSHWVCAVEYNRYYDQLVITGSSSTEVTLWRAIVQSSQALNMATKSGVVSVYTEEDKELALCTTELDDSVYVAKWSHQEPWVYAALAYSGQLMVTHIPHEEKYKIMI